MPTVAERFQTALNLLNGWGFKTATVAGWQTRTARKDIPYQPQGVVNHHTGAWETKDDLLFRTGRTGLPAPLCQWAVQVDGTITCGAAGYANGAGINNQAAVEALIAGMPLNSEWHPAGDTPNYSGNRRTISIEVKAPGAYNEAQRAATVALNAALILAFGWSKTRPPVGAHKEITRRKPGDPGDDMGKFRADVVAFIAAKATPVPDPEPTPDPEPVPAVAPIRIGVANCQSYDGDKSAAAWTARGLKMKAEKRNVWCVSETSKPGRDVLCAVLGKTWKAKALADKTVAVLYDSAELAPRLTRPALFGTPFGHGAIAVPLYNAAAKLGTDVIAVHCRPHTVATLAQKQGDARKAASLAGTWPSVIAGDFAQQDPPLPGWVRQTLNVDTMDATGEQHVDAAFTKGPWTATNSRRIDPGNLSDHKWLAVDLTPNTTK